ncbi:MAG TPA: ABC transporter substrate-binding protein [Oligoflexus sp.]|uniref:ABC transporter substrate-binding protein n=1 Tax=Oligoflexus sp. TaxID=1971216 RepID=UPI002D650B51|nr:ABC transporter substrate-binding protein [Oligoflexus sp.]HYX36307.1 ABC transporter substrate-binding protein [Oligoflexus sp.]
MTLYITRVLGIVLILAPLSCISSPKASSKLPTILVSSGTQDPFDPEQSAQSSFTLRYSFYCHAFELQPDQTLRPDVVRSFRWSPDYRQLTLEIDPAARFHDGKAVTTQDLEYALVRPFLATRGEAERAYAIIGAEHIKSGSPFQSGMLSGIKIQDAKTLTISLKYPDNTLPAWLSSDATRIVPFGVLADDHATFEKTPVSCGDYAVVHRTADGSVYRMKKHRGPADAPAELELWNYAFDKLPAKPDIMQGGHFPKDKVDNSYYRFQWGETPVMVFTLVLNDKAPLVKEAAFRKALDLAIPRQKIASYRNDIPTRDLTAPGSPADLGLPVIENLDEAKRLWITLPKGLRERTYRIVIKTNYPGPYFKLIEDNLRTIGMKVSLIAKQMRHFESSDEDALALGIGFILLKANPVAMYQRFDRRNLHADPIPAFAQPELQELIDAYKPQFEAPGIQAASQKIAHYVLGRNLVIPITYSRQLLALSPHVKSYAGAWDAGINLRLIRVESK